MIEFNAFWRGVHEEFRKEGFMATGMAAQALDVAQEHPVAASLGVAGAGLGAIGVGRAIFKKAPEAAAQVVNKGFSGKAMLGAGAVAAGLGYWAGKKKSE